MRVPTWARWGVVAAVVFLTSAGMDLVENKSMNSSVIMGFFISALFLIVAYVERRRAFPRR